MVKVVFYSWNIGARKIPFIKLLHENTKLSLAQAKEVKDSVIDRNEIVEIELESEEVAIKIVEESKKLGLNCKIKDHK